MGRPAPRKAQAATRRISDEPHANSTCSGFTPVEASDPLCHFAIFPEGVTVRHAGGGTYGTRHPGRQTVGILITVQKDESIACPVGLNRIRCRNVSPPPAGGRSCSGASTERTQEVSSRFNHADPLRRLLDNDLLAMTEAQVSYANTSASRNAVPRLSFTETVGEVVSRQSIFNVGSFHAIVRSASGS